MCGLPFMKPDQWNPDRSGVVKRLHCSLQCDRMYRIAYASDHILRLEHALKRAQDELNEGANGVRAVELKLRVRALKRSIKKEKAQATEARALKKLA